MNSTREQLKVLLDKEELLPEEKAWFLNYIENTGQQELKDMLKIEFDNNVNNPQPINSFLSRKILEQVHQNIGFPEQEEPKIVRLWFKRIAVAAAIIGILSYGAWFFVGKNKADIIARNHKSHTFKNDVGPATEKAVLALADGSKLMLDKVKNGTIISQGGVNVLKTTGKVAYNPVNNINATAFNTLTTPRGGHYQVELPDGTEVWLNAASSIRYPTFFIGNKRVVEITGEAYFEVAKNKNMPFIVKVNHSEVRVYGTHFNVMAYNDESAVKTTLLEGSVKCTSANSSCMLKPGEQAELEKDGEYKVTTAADVNDAVAWKNGLFHFEDDDIETVMRQISRAYNVDVVYNKKTNDHFFAEIPLNSQLSDVLTILDKTGKVHFDIKGRQIIVNP